MAGILYGDLRLMYYQISAIYLRFRNQIMGKPSFYLTPFLCDSETCVKVVIIVTLESSHCLNFD
jgi:hypothetical protein